MATGVIFTAVAISALSKDIASMHRYLSLLFSGVATALLLSPLAAVSMTSTLSELAPEFGNQRVMIEDSNGTVSASELRQLIKEFSIEHDTAVSHSVYETEAHLEDPDAQLITYAVTAPPGHPLSDMVRKGNRKFVPQSPMKLLDLMQETTLDPRGVYALSGPKGVDQKFLEMAQAHGLNGQTQNIVGVTGALSATPILVTVSLVGLLVFGLSAAHVIFRSRTYAIHQMLGLPLRRTIFMEAREIALPTAILAAAAGGFTSISLALYNQFAEIGLFLRFFLIVLIVQAVLIASAYLLSQAALRSTTLVNAIKGARPMSQISISIMALRILAIILTLGTAGSMTALVIESDRVEADRPWWDNRGDAVQIGVAAGKINSVPELGATLRMIDSNDELLLVSTEWARGSEALSHPLVLSNTHFALTEAGLSEEDLGGDATTVTVLTPADTPERDIVHISTTLEFEAGLAGIESPSIKQVPYSDDREVFTYRTLSRGAFLEPSTVHSPIIVVLPRGLSTLSDRNIGALATNNALLLNNSMVAEQLINVPPDDRLVAAATPAVNTWNEARSNLRIQLHMEGINVLLATIIITAIVLVSAVSYQIKNNLRLHVGFLLGRKPWFLRRGLMAMEILTWLIPAVWVIRRIQVLHENTAMNNPSGDFLSRSGAISPQLIVVIFVLITFWSLLTLSMTAYLDRTQIKRPHT
ncbi:hypothetical protein [Corynebacterium pacaense]|uniref:hypothetical protein n=1 Tax=Corynebacterium pacaense TaxID=1816684 RepID=UPI001177651A|nr:hypothetical protein [Corynebacterium pacaense]